MRLLFMGTGTSHGVPMIGCSCPVCTSPDPRNRRTRSSLLVTCRDKNILIDTATELRLQASPLMSPVWMPSFIPISMQTMFWLR